MPASSPSPGSAAAVVARCPASSGRRSRRCCRRCTRTMVSVSLMCCAASGSVIAPPNRAQVDDPVVLGHLADRRVDVQDDVAVLVDLRRDIEHDAGEERRHRDASATGAWCRRGRSVVVDAATLVTKNSSVPTLSTAFWLLSVAMRGLDSTCTVPCVSRNCSSAAKFCVWIASPNSAPPGTPAVSVSGAGHHGADAAPPAST